MTAESYLESVITKYAINEAGVKSQVVATYPVVKRWGGTFINESIYCGSIAKGTAISIGTDADVFISLTSTTPNTLEQIYNTLFDAFSQAGYTPRKQNVSIGITVGGYKIDWVPGKRQSQFGYDHSLYKRKANSWTKTNVKTHVSNVGSSNRLKEIKLAKIWRQLHGLDFPSFYLELAVIDCLRGRSYSDLSGNFWEILRFFRDEFPTKRYLDPSNANNVISDDLTLTEKRKIQDMANISRAKKTWQEIVW
jgi:hypothetical protein